MRIEAFGPRTWLLATLAGWALLVWILALFGMGAQIRPLDDDPALVSALPRLPVQQPERLGPLSQYAEIADRPVFHPSRTPQPFFVSGQEQGEQTQAFDYVLSSVLITPRLQMAILQPAQGGEGIRLKVGEAPESASGWRVVEIHPRSVLVQGPDGPRTLELRVFDGVGGQPVSAAPGATAAPGVPPASMPSGPSGPTPPMATPSKPMPVSPATPIPTPTPGTAAQSMPQADAQTTEQQMEAIRQRIEARRAQLRQQGESPPPQNKTK